MGNIINPGLAVKRILVVDDEPTLVATLQYNLEREGYQVDTALDGESAIATARAVRPDLIILDVMLPGLDGLEVCRILRRDTSAPILLLTAKVRNKIDKMFDASDAVTKLHASRETK